MKEKNVTTGRKNRDPITGEPGFHPVGNVAGGLPGAMAGAAIGAAGGPIGIVLGATIGGLLGGAAGDALAEELNPTDVDAFWENEYQNHDFGKGRSYAEVRDPLYFGTQERIRLGVDGNDFTSAEPDMKDRWATRGMKGSWQDVRGAVKAGYQRASDEIEEAVPGDADGDGK